MARKRKKSERSGEILPDDLAHLRETWSSLDPEGQTAMEQVTARFFKEYDEYLDRWAAAIEAHLQSLDREQEARKPGPKKKRSKPRRSPKKDKPL